MIKKLKRKIVAFIMLTIGLISLIFVTGASVYNIKQTERDLYNSLTAAAERASKPDGDKDKPEIGKDQPDRLAPTNVCVVKYTVDSFGATVVTTVSGNANLSADVVNKAAKATAESAGYGQNSPRPQKKDGKLESYDLAYSVSVTPDGAYIAFADYDYLRSSTRKTLVVAGLIEVSFLLAIFLLSVFLAKVAVKPVEKSIEEQKRFVADASHELKTPLAVISANNEILLSSAGAEQKEWLNSSQEEISGMKDVINDMLTLAQNDAVCETEKTDADLSKILSGVTLQFEAVAYEKTVELRADIADGVWIKCDQKAIKKLFTILIDNAIKYEPENGKVLVTLQNPCKKATVTITNFGSVISEKDLPHIFERFYRSAEARSREGVGLGLAIAKSLVDRHGGSIKVTSTKENGTTFKVEL